MVAVEPIFAQTLVARDRSRNLAPDALEVIDPDRNTAENKPKVRWTYADR